MIDAIVRSMLGPLAIILDYIIQNPVIASIILFVYLSIYMAGYFQLRNIENKTTLLVLEFSKEEVKRKPNITSGGLYKKIYPTWEKELKTWGIFVPHRLELWPVPVSADVIKQKLSFNPQWIADLLKKNNITLVENEVKTLSE
ncbi:MAG: hypothetical protein LWX83_13980 [Anaerolineae bacterium]|nr:hypothetical protein [Anaerolineae bacterium]